MSRRHQSILNVLSPSFSNVNSFTFDGVDERLEGVFNGKSTSVFGSNPNISLSMWFKCGYTHGQELFGWTQNMTKDFHFIRLIFVRTAPFSGEMNLIFSTISTSSPVSQNVWHNVVVTRNSTGPVWSMYLDGVLQGTQNSDSGVIQSRADIVYIGAGTGSQNPYDGFVDETSIWNTTLSSDAVTEIYNSGAPNDLTTLTHASSSDLISWFRLGDKATFSNPGGIGNWTLTDQGSGNNNLTSVNMEESDRTTETPT